MSENQSAPVDTVKMYSLFLVRTVYPLINNHDGDSYALALEESAKEIAEHCKLPNWTVAWQSAAPQWAMVGTYRRGCYQRSLTNWCYSHCFCTIWICKQSR